MIIKHISLFFLLLFQLIADLNENFLQILKIQGGGQGPPLDHSGGFSPPLPPLFTPLGRTEGQSESKKKQGEVKERLSTSLLWIYYTMKN